MSNHPFRDRVRRPASAGGQTAPRSPARLPACTKSDTGVSIISISARGGQTVQAALSVHGTHTCRPPTPTLPPQRRIAVDRLGTLPEKGRNAPTPVLAGHSSEPILKAVLCLDGSASAPHRSGVGNSLRYDWIILTRQSNHIGIVFTDLPRRPDDKLGLLDPILGQQARGFAPASGQNRPISRAAGTRMLAASDAFATPSGGPRGARSGRRHDEPTPACRRAAGRQ
jgi:hypothetical protein